jgi:hypothetical protein
VIRHVRTAAMLLACLVGFSSAARAGIIEIIDEMSGPGPYWGIGGDIRIYCAGIANESGGPSTPLPAKLTKGDWSWLTRPLSYSRCLANKLPTNQRPWISLDLQFMYARSIHNYLTYPANPDDKHISVYSLEPAIWWTPIPPVAVGTAVGVDLFRGPTFSSFSQVHVVPVQVDLKPFAFAKDRWFSNGASLITIRAGFELSPQGFNAPGFGSTGSFSVGHESRGRVMVLFDGGQWSWLR